MDVAFCFYFFIDIEERKSSLIPNLMVKQTWSNRHGSNNMVEPCQSDKLIAKTSIND